ncbi:unnamed protein product [Macrosiphum euphorbiae]|uniref:Major facilitator superfamily associated domain-containing protein n=1 Tax=Macrosiphum euphorbiae TaxID=13131 RepID=A0AAV0XU50_9HEMI|nr:unnamed protein product [Macrosiphum euphorbiae]
MLPIRIRINKRTLRMKLHYFLYMGGIASVQGFAPTIAKQLGYSPMVVGSVFTYLSMLSFFVKPIVGIIVDKFRVKRIMFLAFVLSCGLTAFSLNFIQKIPTEAAANLSCGNTTVLNVCSNDDDRLSQCDDSLLKLIKNIAEPIECQLRCEQNEPFRDEIYKSWSIVDHNININTNTTYKNDGFEDLDVTLIIGATDQIEKNDVVFQVKSAHIMKTQVAFPYCQRQVSTRCKIDCSNDVVMELATVQKFEGSIFGLHQFWKYLTVMSLFWISQAITWSLQDPICFDILDDKPEDFGKQRCWGSISWGIFSVFGGVLVDYFSNSDYEKNYVPVYYLCLIIILWDFALAYKIEITETIGSKNTFSDVFKLITNMNVIVYLIWIVVMGICTTMPWNYLFWYMEDLTQKYHSDKQSWTKTLQGLAIGIQCIGGELPLLFFSGWFIKRIGHTYCMALGLFAFALRFYLYSVITNPIWILPVEFTNGITFGLCHAVLLAYARFIAPQSSATTVVALSGALFEGVGTSIGGLVGGFMYQTYGGERTFELFAYGSLIMGILHVIFIKLNNRSIKMKTTQ